MRGKRRGGKVSKSQADRVDIENLHHHVARGRRRHPPTRHMPVCMLCGPNWGGLTNIDDKQVVGIGHEARAGNDNTEQALPGVHLGRLVEVVVLGMVVRQALLCLLDVRGHVHHDDWWGVLRCGHCCLGAGEAGLSRRGKVMRSQVRPGWRAKRGE